MYLHPSLWNREKLTKELEFWRERSIYWRDKWRVVKRMSDKSDTTGRRAYLHTHMEVLQDLHSQAVTNYKHVRSVLENDYPADTS